VLPAKRTAAVTIGLLATTALYGCAQNRAADYGPANRAVPVNADVSDPPSPPAPSAPPAEPVGVTSASLTATTIAKMGQVVTDDQGWVLYRFDNDTADPPSSACDGTCAQVWPPLLADGIPALRGLDANRVGTVRRADGGMQVTLGGWPLYRYIGDARPGQWKGQGVNGTWFVVAPDGRKNLTCLPSGTPTPMAPPAAEPTAGDGGTGGGYGY